MDLYEHEGKDILRNRGLDVPVGHVCRDISELEAVLGTISFPAMLKAQVLAGGRGKAGAVRKVEDAVSAL